MGSVRRQSMRLLQSMSPFRPRSSLSRSPFARSPGDHSTPVVQSAEAFVPSCPLSPASSQMSPDPVSQQTPVIPPTSPIVQCPTCTRNIGNTGVSCDLCDNWFHLKCVGLGGMSNDTYSSLGKYDCIKVFCPPCLAKISSFCSGSNPPVKDAAAQTHLDPEPTLLSDSSPLDSSILPITQPPAVRLPLPRRLIPRTAFKPYRIVKGFSDPLSNMYQFDFKHGDVRTTSVEHTYQYQRATDQNLPDLARQIASAHHAGAAKKLSKFLSRPDDRQRDLDYMRELLESKSRQCSSFRQALRSSGTASILHSTYPGKNEEFWGTGLDHRDKARHGKGEFPGKNWLGVMLMDIRKDLGPESDYDATRIDAAHFNGFVVILNDGEVLTKPDKPNFARNMDTNVRNSCFLCGETGHIARICRMRNKGFGCYRCGQSGHKVANCASRSGARQYNSGGRPFNSGTLPLFARNVPRPVGF